MATPKDGPNPLRPYYIPPVIGNTQGGNSTAAGSASATKTGASTNYASAAREVFIDIDYSDYLSESSQSTWETIKELLDQALYKYMSVLLSQPFENAKTILQVRDQSGGEGIILGLRDGVSRDRRSQYEDTSYPEHYGSDSDPDEPAYFTSSAPDTTPYNPSRSRRRHNRDDDGSPTPSSGETPKYKLNLKRSDSVLEALGAFWSVEGSYGVWKGSNSTFVYGVLLKTTETWTRGMLSALLNVPDPGLIAGLGVGVDVVDSPYPWASLAVAVGAAAVAGLVLAPLDIVRTKLIVTPVTNKKRSYLHNLKILPSYVCPPSLFVPTILHSVISPFVTHSTPLLLRARMGISPTQTPSTYSIATFLSSTAELFLRLPIETVLRRGQVQVLSSQTYLEDRDPLKTIVNVGQYRGTIGTMWCITREEGVSKVASRPGKKSRSERPGQGIEGLWRGWRVGMWGLVGIWSVAAFGGTGSSGGEF